MTIFSGNVSGVNSPYKNTIRNEMDSNSICLVLLTQSALAEKATWSPENKIHPAPSSSKVGPRTPEN